MCWLASIISGGKKDDLLKRWIFLHFFSHSLLSKHLSHYMSEMLLVVIYELKSGDNKSIGNGYNL